MSYKILVHLGLNVFFYTFVVGANVCTRNKINSTMKKLTIFIIAIFSVWELSAGPVRNGIDILKNQDFKILEGKRVGLITNPTGVDGQLKSTIDILFESPKVNLVALYGPEHGVRGDKYAGDKVDSGTDTKTGLPVYSLYGKTHKPTPEMLNGVDVLVYDIQDNGCRSFTYISSMGLAMEAAAENNIEFIVLDRPNPLGGLKIEGNITEDKYISFVSQFKIPYIYGLTCGELALMLNEERMISKKVKLTVLKMKGWKRHMNWEQTGLEWVVASPHIPHKHSSYYYPATGIMGELGYISIGVGYTLPFQIVGAPWINADTLATRMNDLKLAGTIFRPIHFKPYYATLKNELCQGVEIHFVDYQKAKLTESQFYIMQELNKLYPDKAVLNNADTSRFNMFDKVCGSNNIREIFALNHLFSHIKDYWYKDVNDFRKLSKKYYLYK